MSRMLCPRFELGQPPESVSGGSAPPERVEEGTELAFGLVDLGIRAASRDDSGTRVERRPIAAELRAPQRDRPFAVAGRVYPPHRARVRAPVERLELFDHVQGSGPRLARDSRRRMERPNQLQDARRRLPEQAS